MSAYKILPSFESGNGNKNVVVFISGYPDDERSGWGANLDAIGSLPDVHLISMCLPGLEKNPKPHRPWGYSFPEILSLIHETINHYVPDESKKVNLVIHDWGAYTGLCYANKYPERIEKIVDIDVGLIGKGLPFNQVLIIFLYQLWFAFAYIISQFFGSYLGNIVYFLFYLLPNFVQCLQKGYKVGFKVKSLDVKQCYLYYQLWYAILFDRSKLLTPKFPAARLLFMVSVAFYVLYFFLVLFNHLNL